MYVYVGYIGVHNWPGGLRICYTPYMDGQGKIIVFIYRLNNYIIL